MSKPLKAAVIGSGFGGLSAAIRLQNLGFETTIFEKRDQPGGRAYVYRDQGFTFDAGPTVITAPQCLEELFEISGAQLSDYVDLLPVQPFYQLCWDDGYRFNYDGNLEHTLAQIQKRSPRDVIGYQKFLEYSKKVFDAGYTDLVHVPFLDFKSMLKAAPDLVRLKAYRSVYSMVSQYIKDERLKEAFSFHSLLVGGNPFESSSIYTLIHYLERNWGVFFPKGGTGALISGLVKLFEEKGGVLKLNSPIDEILIHQNKVAGIKTQEGIETFDIVISNADVMHTYSHLLRNTDRGASAAKALMKKRWSMSLFLIYFGTNRKYPNLSHHSILFGPRYKGLLQDIFHSGRLAEDMSLYLHAPTRTDPSLAPEGHESFYVLSPVPHLGQSKDIDRIHWKTEGPRYADRILKRLEKNLLPHLRKHIVTQRIFTPEDFKHELNSHWGSAFSLEPILTQSAYFRTHNRDPQISGLYFVGAGTHPGAGVPGVVNSAKATLQVITQDFKSSLTPQARMNGNELQ